jgi:hypothetical protein
LDRKHRQQRKGFRSDRLPPQGAATHKGKTMIADIPPFDLYQTVTAETVCDAQGCMDGIEAFNICGQIVYVGSKTPTYVVLPGTPCTAIHEPMGIKDDG